MSAIVHHPAQHSGYIRDCECGPIGEEGDAEMTVPVAVLEMRKRAHAIVMLAYNVKGAATAGDLVAFKSACAALEDQLREERCP